MLRCALKRTKTYENYENGYKVPIERKTRFGQPSYPLLLVVHTYCGGGLNCQLAARRLIFALISLEELMFLTLANNLSQVVRNEGVASSCSRGETRRRGCR